MPSRRREGFRHARIWEPSKTWNCKKMERSRGRIRRGDGDAGTEAYYGGIDDDDGTQPPHHFTITYDSGSSVDPNAVQPGVSPTFTYKALTNAEVHFLDTRPCTQTISARALSSARTKSRPHT